MSITCNRENYKNYSGYYVTILQARGTGDGREMYYMYCDGPGEDCKVGGPDDGKYIPSVPAWNRDAPETCIIDSLIASDEIINEIKIAFERNELASLKSNPRYNMVFDKAENRDTLLNRLETGTYQIRQMPTKDFVVFEPQGGEQQTKFIYITIMPK